MYKRLGKLFASLIISLLMEQAALPFTSSIACALGVYRLEARSLEEVSASYANKLDEIREAAPQDRQQIADAAFAEAEQLRADDRMESTRRAIKKYEEALSLFQALGDRRGAALALKALGEIYHPIGKPDKAIECYEKALAISREIKNIQLESETLSAAGLALIQLGKRDKALEHGAKALELSRQIDDKHAEAAALVATGEAYYALGNKEKAVEHYEKALPIHQSLGDLKGQAQTLLYLGFSRSELGDTEKAHQLFQQALSLWRNARSLRGEMQALNALGNLSSKTGNKQEAIDFYTQARSLVQLIGDPVEEARALMGIASVYDEFGEKEKTFQYYDDALRLYRSASHQQGEVTALILLARAQRSTGNHQNAITNLRQALAIIRAGNDKRYEPYALMDLASAHDSMGEKKKAFDYYNDALLIYRDMRALRGEAAALNAIALIHNDSGEGEKALELLNRALEINRATEDRLAEVMTLSALARIERDLGRLSEARRHVEDATKRIESLRLKIASYDLRSSYLATVRQAYELLIDVLMRQHKQDGAAGLDALALNVSEQARARGLIEMLAASRIDFSEGVDAALIERERALKQSLNDKGESYSRMLGGRPTEAQVAAAAKEIEAITTELKQVRAQIRAASPRYAAITQPQPLTLSQIQKEVLDPDTLLLEYALGDDRSYLWAVTSDSMTTFELPGRADIEKSARLVYQLLTAQNEFKKGETPQQRDARISRAEADYAKAAEELSRMILAPAVSKLSSKRLVIVADGALQYVPFSALPTPQGSEVRSQGAGSRRQEAEQEATSSNRDANAQALKSNPPGLKSNAQNLKSNAKAIASRPVASDAQRLTPDSRPLPPAYRPLILDHEIINLPSASAIAVLRREIAGRKPAPKAIAIFADPVFSSDDLRVRAAGVSLRSKVRGQSLTRDVEQAIQETGMTRSGSGLPRLPFSRREAEAIAEIAPAGQVMKAVEFDASLDRVMSADLSQYKIIHFATHGLLNSKTPELSGILLSLIDRKGKGQNGFLRLDDVYNLKLSAELVVLSACQTGLGKDVKGEGLIGLTRGFMNAGAARVMSSLWKVDDAATAELMKRFYSKLIVGNKSPAAALREAQVEMWKLTNRQSPYYWAGFVLQGEWKQSADQLR